MYQKVGRIFLPLNTFYVNGPSLLVADGGSTGRLRPVTRDSLRENTFLTEEECRICRVPVFAYANSRLPPVCSDCVQDYVDSADLRGSSSLHYVSPLIGNTETVTNTETLGKPRDGNWSRNNDVNYQHKMSNLLIRAMIGRHLGQPALGLGDGSPFILRRVAYSWEEADSIARDMKPVVV